MQLVEMPEKTNYEEVAIALWQTYEALLDQGFSEGQALAIVIGMMQGAQR